jgi:hypothetical protein
LVAIGWDQDAGCYPFGSPFVRDLTREVRSGHFVVTVLKNALSIDESAFALGAPAHDVCEPPYA